MNTQNPLKSLTTEEERIGVLMDAHGFFFVEPRHLYDAILHVAAALPLGPDGVRTALEQVCGMWGSTLPLPDRFVRDLLDPQRTYYMWRDQSETERDWFFRCCDGEVRRGGHAASCRS